MKLLKIGIISFLAAALFSSCLNDGDNEFSTTCYAYIKDDNAQKYAVTPFFLIKSTEIENLPTSSCAIVSYKVKNYGSGINPAENVKVEKLYQSPNVKRGVADDMIDNMISTYGVTEVYPSDFSFDGSYYSYNRQYYAFEDYFEDNWLFFTKFNKEDDMKVTPYFFYNPAQEIWTTDEEGNPAMEEELQPKDNEVIIDVRFVENSTMDGSFTAPANNEVKYFAGNLSILRQLPDIIDKLVDTDASKDLDFYVVPIKFRYIKEKKNSDGTIERKETILGNWDLNTTGFKYMAISKKD